MSHKILQYPEKTILDLGVQPGVSYTVESGAAPDVFSSIPRYFRYQVGEAMKIFALGNL